MGIEKKPGSFLRSKLLKEIEIYHMCRGQRNIIQLLEFFEEEEKFYLVFEKLNGGPLLEHIQRRKFLTECEASTIVRNMAEAIEFLHSRGIAHRDIKPDNVLCLSTSQTEEVKLCDFDLCSDPAYSYVSSLTTPSLSTPVGSLEYMAPEVVNTFIEDDYDDYDEELDFTTKILEAGRALGDVGQAGAVSPPLDIPARRTTMSFNLSPINASNCDLIQRRRRKSKELFSKFLSIDELETDFFMKAIS